MNKGKSDNNSDSGFIAAQSLFANYQLQDKGGYITREFQDYGYRLAVALEDLEHKSLYIKMAKEIDRSILEQALSFVADAQARNKARLFMWKVAQLKKTKRIKKAKKANKVVSKTNKTKTKSKRSVED